MAYGEQAENALLTVSAVAATIATAGAAAEAGGAVAAVQAAAEQAAAAATRAMTALAARAAPVIAGGTAAAAKVGKAGEDAVRRVEEIGEKVAIQIANRVRIPDGVTSDVVTEVKNVASQSYTQQLRDYSAFAAETGRQFNLWVRPDTSLSGPLQNAISSGEINLRYIPGP
jgi:hypothetical protein